MISGAPAISPVGFMDPKSPVMSSTKARWALLPWDALREVALVFTHGAKHDTDDQPRYRTDARAHSKHFEAAQRHLTAWWLGEDNDPESGRSHLAHAACRILILLSRKALRQHDDRPRPQRKDITGHQWTCPGCHYGGALHYQELTVCANCGRSRI